MKIEDTTKALWDYLYLIKVPELQSRSIEDIQIYGTNLSGNKEYDNDLKNRWIERYANIDTMLEFFKKNVPVKIVNYDDTKNIYDAINRHLLAWKDRLDYGINIGNAPIDDLVYLDEFANTVFEHAKYIFTDEWKLSVLGKELYALQRFNARAMFNQENDIIKRMKNNVDESSDGVTKINDQKKAEIPERDEMADFFKSRLINFRR